MTKIQADSRVVARDICAALFDMAGDWTYFCILYFGGNSGRNHAQYKLLVHVIMSVSILGSVLSLWFIVTSLGRTRRFKSLCCRCTVPRLAMSLILLHHFPQFLLTSYIDMTFRGNITIAGWFNICSSMVALINTLTITKCGEKFCGDGYCGLNEKADDDIEIGTIADTTECDDEGDYKAMEQ